MTLDELKSEIEKDTCISDLALDTESLKIPQLHGKYLNFLFTERMMCKKYQSEFHTLQRDKWEYYTGKTSQEQLDARGWQPFQLKILRSDLDLYLNADADLIKMHQRIGYQQEKVVLLEEIIKELNSRHWKIKNAIDWRKFTNGQ